MKNLNASLKLQTHSHSSKKKKRWIWAAILLVVIIMFTYFNSGSANVYSYVFGGGSGGVQEEDGRVNILLLGIGGEGHEGPNLTDTIMVASYDRKSHQVDLISLPRDLWIQNYKTRINGLYEMGLKKGGNGLDLVEDEVGTVLGLNIPYAVRLDFGGFVRSVDLVDGLDIEVEKTFDDYQYPITGKENDLCGYTEQQIEVDEAKSKELNIPQGKQKVFLKGAEIATDSAHLTLDCRYEHLSFKQGPIHMDGTTALKFVRSRHGNNGEGSDFARSKRQQLVMQSFRSKILSLNTLTDFSKMVGIISNLGNSVATDIPQGQYLEFAKMAKDIKETKSHVINLYGTTALLINPPPDEYGGAWVLIPPNNDFTTIHNYIQDILEGKEEATPSATLKNPDSATKNQQSTAKERSSGSLTKLQ